MIEFLWSGPNGLRWQNNLHFTKGEFDGDDIDDLLEAIEGVFDADDIKADLADSVALVELVGTDMRTQGAIQRTKIVGISGTNVGDMAAQGAALVATLRTGLRGRSYRGRFYLAGLADTLLVDGEWLIAAAQNLSDFISSVLAIADIFGWDLVVLSRWLDQIEREVALGQEVIEILVRSLAPGSQRRRNRRP